MATDAILKKHNGLVRQGVISVDKVLMLLSAISQIHSVKKLEMGGGMKITVDSKRLQVFLHKGTSCRCGLSGSFFAIEKTNPKDIGNKVYHLNLYAIDAMGEEVLMTMDHIIPSSKGGTNYLDNLQPLCYPCNILKSDTLEEIINEPVNCTGTETEINSIWSI